MNIRVDLICLSGHIEKDVILKSVVGKKLRYPRCGEYEHAISQACGDKMEQYYGETKGSERAWVMNGANW